MADGLQREPISHIPGVHDTGRIRFIARSLVVAGGASGTGSTAIESGVRMLWEAGDKPAGDSVGSSIVSVAFWGRRRSVYVSKFCKAKRCATFVGFRTTVVTDRSKAFSGISIPLEDRNEGLETIMAFEEPYRSESVTFSVIIPVYNRAHTVLPTLLSVRYQTHEAFTCLVVDDGSNDSEDLRRVVEGLGDPRFRYIWQKNGGGGAARTNGILASEGDFVAFLDSDDSFTPDKLAVVAQHIVDHPEVDVWTHLASMERGEGVSIIRPTRLPYEGESIADMMFRDREFMQTSTLVVRSAFAKEVRFDHRLRKAQDVDFMIRLERAGARLRCIPQPLSVWNDAPAENRVGAPRRPENVLMWYNEQKPYFERQTRYAFESTYLAYEIGEKQPFRASWNIARALLTGSVGLKLTAITFMRTFIDQRRYRKIIDSILRIKSVRSRSMRIKASSSSGEK